MNWPFAAEYRRRWPGFRPQLESLEDRCLLDAASFTSLPVIPVIDATMTAHLRAVVAQGLQLGNRIDVFAKVGDSITVLPQFLDPLGLPNYDPTDPSVVGPYTYLAPTIDFFRGQIVDATGANSFDHISGAARGGWKTTDLLNPSTQPLVNELTTTRPAFALIMIGTNEAADVAGAAGFQSRLTTIVQTALAYGVVPVLSTIPDLLVNGSTSEAGVPVYNQIIANVAAQLNVPLWNYWAALQALPNKGLDATLVHPDTYPAGAGFFTEPALQYGFNVRNLTAVQVLDDLERVVLQVGANDAPSPEILSFVTRLYQSVLGRAPDPGGLANFTTQIQNGSARASVVTTLWQSPEHRRREVESFYETYLHRQADPTGSGYWTAALTGGAGELSVEQGLMTSPEYLAEHPTNATFLAGVYQDVLAQAPSVSVVVSWLPLLQIPALRAYFVQAVLTSSGADGRFVTQDYATFLGRALDPAGAQFWIGQLQSGTATQETVGEGILLSDEFARAV